MSDKSIFERYSDFTKHESQGELIILSGYNYRMFKPYKSFASQLSHTVLYPMYQPLSFGLHLGSALWGCCLFIGSIFSNPSKSTPEVFFGLTRCLAAMAISLVNLLASLVSIPTQTVATIFNLGYGDPSDDCDELDDPELKGWMKVKTE